MGSILDVLDYPRNENHGEKVKINQIFSAADANKKRGQPALSSLQRIVGEIMDFPNLKTKTSDKLFRSKLTSSACEPTAGLTNLLANRD